MNSINESPARTTLSPTDPPQRSVAGQGPYVALRVLATVAALVGLAGATYFTFVADPADGGPHTPFGWFVGLWKIVIAVTMLSATVGPGLARHTRMSVLTWALVADLAFCAVKLGVYHEAASIPFTVADLLLLALAGAARRSAGRE